MTDWTQNILKQDDWTIRQTNFGWFYSWLESPWFSSPEWVEDDLKVNTWNRTY